MNGVVTMQGGNVQRPAPADAPRWAPAGEQPVVSVIIPVKDDPRRLAKCLEALAQQSLGAGRFEVLVVDNGSAEPVDVRADIGLDVTVLHESRPGSYAARNRGIENARGAVFAFTDSDCVPAPDWLERGLRALQAAGDEVGAVAGRITLFEEATEDDAAPDGIAARFEQLFGYAKFDQERFVAGGHCITANWFSWAEVVRAAGGFDARLKSRGDFDLAERLTQRGKAIVYAPDAVVGHPIRATRDEIVAKQCRVIGGKWQAFEGRHRLAHLWRAIFGNGGRRLVRVLRAPGLPWPTRLRLAAFVARLWWASSLEVVRLERGMPPKAF